MLDPILEMRSLTKTTSLAPNWEMLLLLEEVPDRVSPDFKYLGPGWYKSGVGVSVLVVPHGVPTDRLWGQKVWPEGTRFLFAEYDDNVANFLRKISAAPTRSER